MLGQVRYTFKEQAVMIDAITTLINEALLVNWQYIQNNQNQSIFEEHNILCFYFSCYRWMKKNLWRCLHVQRTAIILRCKQKHQLKVTQSSLVETDKQKIAQCGNRTKLWAVHFIRGPTSQEILRQLPKSGARYCN